MRMQEILDQIACFVTSVVIALGGAWVASTLMFVDAIA